MLKNDAHRKELTQFKVSFHTLAVEIGSYIGIVR